MPASLRKLSSSPQRKVVTSPSDIQDYFLSVALVTFPLASFVIVSLFLSPILEYAFLLDGGGNLSFLQCYIVEQDANDYLVMSRPLIDEKTESQRQRKTQVFPFHHSRRYLPCVEPKALNTPF